jgi:CRP-like cAMP-binding protein
MITSFRTGERILLDSDGTLQVLEGVVALTVIHEDGTEVLLGLCGPGQVVAGHADEACCIQLRAQTATVVRMQPWAEASHQPGFADRLRERLRSAEAWAAMQALPHIEQRLLGILSLLARQFGRPAGDGTVIEVLITQAQLASAVGATRTTVTRLLGHLRRRGLLIALRAGRFERYGLRNAMGASGTPCAVPHLPSDERSLY